MSLRVSVDFGTSSTCTVVSVDGGDPQVVVIDGQPLVPSAVFAAADGTLFVGQEAERQAAVDPARFEPHPKRRIDEGELLLGNAVLKVGDVVRAVLQRVVGEARRYAGNAAVDLLVLTHPADWGSVRTQQLRQAAAGLARELALVPEPVAAAVFHSAGHGLPDGGALAVLDLGGGTVDASVVAKRGSSFRVLATRGDPDFGGADIDQALLEHVGGIVTGADRSEWKQLVTGRAMADRRRRRVLRQDIRGAKETLSRHTYTDVPLPAPFSDAHVTRADLERLVAGPLGKAAELVPTTLREGRVPRGQLVGVFLVGGSSRIPLISRLIHERTGVLPTTLDQPETVVARGALRAVLQDPDRTGGLTVAAGACAPPGASPHGASPHGAPSQGAPSQGGAPRAPRPGRSPGVPGPGTPPGGQPAGPSSGPSSGPVQVPAQASAPANDSLSQASTIVIGGSDVTKTVQPPGAAHRSRVRKRWLISGGLGAVVLLGIVLALFLGGPGQSQQLTAYQYTFEYPASWQKTAEDPAKWKTVVEPENGGGHTLIAVQQGELASRRSDPADAATDLRREYVTKVNEGQRFSGFDESRDFGGRDVVFYREELADATVEWYVIHEKRYRVSVGCQHGAAGPGEVRATCEQIVRSLVVR
ncbi:type VII secretion-associated protein [Parasphingorhabdus pacifica]